MSNITITLTKDQAYQVIHSLNNDWIDNEVKSQGFIQRVVAKIEKALAQAKS